MKLIECKNISELDFFEYEVAQALCSSNVSGFALVSPTIECKGLIYEIDFILLLKNGNIVCVEAKGYKGEWTGSLNQSWYANGRIINCSRGKTPIEQCHSYSTVVKNKLELILNTQKNLFVYAIVVTPDDTSFNLDFGYQLNKIAPGKSTNICQLSKLTKVLNELDKNEIIEQKFIDLGGKSIICYLTGINDNEFDKVLIGNIEELENRRNKESIKESILDKSKDSIEAIYSVEETRIEIQAEEVTSQTQAVPREHSKNNRYNPVIFVILLSFILVVSFSIKKFIAKDKSINLIIGGLSKGSNVLNYQKLQDYLGKTWVNVDIDILDETDPSSYLKAKQKIRNREWSIVFAYSPIISAEAEKFGYTAIATMFPGSNKYQSVLLTSKTSKLENISDLDETYTVIFKNSNSASGFYFPLYELYQSGGKPITVNVEFDSKTVEDRILKDKNLVGAFSYSDDKKGEFDKFKQISSSRAIPGSQVYISPSLSKDKEKIVKKLLNASKDIKDSANYGHLESPQDYTEMNKIKEKVNELVSCDDYRKGIVTIGCDKNKEKSVLTLGNVFRVDIKKDKDILNIQTKKSICKFDLPKNMSDQVRNFYGLNSISSLPTKINEVAIQHTLDLKSKECKPTKEYILHDLSQINFSSN